MNFIYRFLFDNGVASTGIDATIWVCAIYISVAVAIYYLMTRPLCRLVQHIVSKTTTLWDDRLLQPRIFHAIVIVILLYCARYSLHNILYFYPQLLPMVSKAVRVLLIISWGVLLYRVVNVVYVGMREDEISVSGLAVLRNVLNSAIMAVCALLIVSIIMSRSIGMLLSGLGAMAAVLSLVFKESILGMIAGIRLVANHMICHNDWIRMPSRNIDGRIKDISLTAVKVRNWDNSITTVPPHALISEGFCNMEDMLRCGSRRIMRSLNIDLHSIRTLSPAELTALNISHCGLEPHISKAINADTGLSNITLWRHHLEHLIRQHPLADLQQRYMVRELAPTEHGLPIELFFFLKCHEWEKFESLQSDFIDTVIASAHTFGLRFYQLPLTSSAITDPVVAKLPLIETTSPAS